MRRRTYQFEILEIILCLVIVVCTVLLFFKANTLTVLYPVVFGASSLASFLYAFEGIWYNKDRVVRRSRLIIFLSMAVILAGVTYLSVKVIFF